MNSDDKFSFIIVLSAFTSRKSSYKFLVAFYKKIKEAHWNAIINNLKWWKIKKIIVFKWQKMHIGLCTSRSK